MTAQPRALSWQGTIWADALWLDPALLGEAALRQRVLSLWSVGCVAHGLQGGVLLRFPVARRIEARTAPGVLLCREAGTQRLWAAPLTPAERAQVAAPPGAVILLRGGVARAIPLEEATPLDPAAWLDTAALAWQDTAALGTPPPPPAPAPEAVTLQARLGTLPSQELRALLGDLLANTGEKGEGAGKQGGAWSLGAGAAAAGAASSMAGAARDWLGQTAGTMGDGLGGLRDLFRRGERWLDDLAARTGALGALQQLGSQRGAEHLRRLLGMFDREDTDNALRNAIPLSRTPRPEGEGDAGGGGSLGEALGGLFGWGRAPRDSTALTGGGGPQRVSSLTLGAQLFQRLESLYRATHARLDAAGRHAEAAYVLAELLDVPEEAVDYLESRGAWGLAAELAESRRMDVPRIAQLWMKADNRPRVLLMLRLTDRFADTVQRLEASGDTEGAAWLRRCWALSLSHAGRLGAAVEVIWPLEADRPLALRWLDQAIALRGITGAQAVGRKLSLRPELAETLREPLAAYLQDPSPEGQATRIALAGILSVPGRAALARPLLRHLLREQATAAQPGRWEAIRALAAATDPALDADLPTTLAAMPPPQAPPPPLTALTIAAADTGTRPALDAGRVRGARMLVALGEGGCLLLGSDGRPEHRFAAPAERLVLAQSGVVALALIRRGEGWLIHHLDLSSRQERLWLEGVRLDTFAPAYDGDLWYIGLKGALVAVDAQDRQPRLQILWSARPLDRILSIRWSVRLLVAIGQRQDHPGRVEHHRYSLPGPTAHRALLNLAVETAAASSPLPLQEEIAVCSPSHDAIALVTASGRTALSPGLSPPLPLRLLDTDPAQNLLAVGQPGMVQILKRLRPPAPSSSAAAPNHTPVFSLHAPGASRWRVRLTEDAWVFCDDQGRVVGVRADGPGPSLWLSARL